MPDEQQTDVEDLARRAVEYAEARAEAYESLSSTFRGAADFTAALAKMARAEAAYLEYGRTVAETVRAAMPPLFPPFPGFPPASGQEPGSEPLPPPWLMPWWELFRPRS